MFIALGDSHTRYYSGVCDYLFVCPGATAYGLKNYGSSSGMRKVTDFVLTHLGTSHKYIIQLGEVDCNSLSWLYGSAAMEEFIEKACRTYQEYLAQWPTHNIYVASCPPPVVESYSGSPNRNAIKTDVATRLELVKQFNLLMRSNKHSTYKYFNYFDQVFKDGQVLEQYKRDNKLTPHLKSPAINMLIKELAGVKKPVTSCGLSWDKGVVTLT